MCQLGQKLSEFIDKNTQLYDLYRKCILHIKSKLYENKRIEKRYPMQTVFMGKLEWLY